MINRRDFIALGALSTLAVGVQPAFAQAWPTRPVRLVVPYAPGGTTDATARIVADHLSRIWGQQVIIENKPGQGANIGAETVARADPDGYTMLIAVSSMAANKNLYRSLKYDLVTDLAPVCRLVTFPLVFFVPNASPVKSITDLIAYAKERNGNLTFGTPAYGGLNHLTGELFKRMAGIQMTHVPYRGDALAMTDLIAGRLDLQIAGTVQLEQSRAGQARALAVTTAATSSRRRRDTNRRRVRPPGIQRSGLVWTSRAGKGLFRYREEDERRYDRHARRRERQGKA